MARTPAQAREYLKKWKLENPDKHLEHRRKEREKNRERRLRIIYAYSNGFMCCECCGQDFPDFLVLDHIVSFKDKGIPRDHPEGQNWYVQLERDDYPVDDNIRVLCANCNTCLARTDTTFESLKKDLKEHREARNGETYSGRAGEVGYCLHARTP